MIGFYLTQKYADLLRGNENPERKLLIDALAHGIKEDHPVDFVLASEAQLACRISAEEVWHGGSREQYRRSGRVPKQDE